MSVMFPKWMNALPTLGAIFGLGGLTVTVGGFWYYATPEFWEVGYMPRQPGSGFNHQLHAGMLGMDCRYCHTHVESSEEANIPPVATCIGCHAENHLALDVETRVGPRVEFLREAYAQDRSVQWNRVHKLPDYVRNFPHNVHVQAGVSCYSCHGQITGMPVVYQAKSLSMSWCLDCHRNVNDRPEDYLAPPDRVTHLKWVEEEWFNKSEAHKGEAERLLEAMKRNARNIHWPPDNCGACHY